MDARISALIDELKNSENIDPIATRHRIVELFDDVPEEEDRVSLLFALNAVIGLAIRSQEAQGIDSQPLRNALLGDKRLFVIKEASGPDGLAEPTEQLRILEREIAAGRMEKDDFYDLTLAGAKVFGPPPAKRERTGFMKRLFG